MKCQHYLEMDVTKEEDVVAGVERINEEQGGTNILINNAGFGSYGAMEDTPLDEARYQFEVNLFGAARLTQLVLPYMREQGAGKDCEHLLHRREGLYPTFPISTLQGVP